MTALRDEHGVCALSEVFGVSTSGLHKTFRRSASPGPRAEANRQLLEEIRDVHREHKGRYGSPRMTMELRRRGFGCGENRVARLMRRHGIAGMRARRKTPRTTDSRHGGLIAPNRLKSLEITGPNQAWAMDITYVRVGAGFAYLAAVQDLFTRQIVGWQIADHMRSGLVEDALSNAARRMSPPPGLTIHSDRGSQYASDDFIALAKSLRFERSMSAKGNCYDNATMESFFGVLKREELDQMKFTSLEEARQSVFSYIEAYYNTRRIHTSLGMTPAEFRESWGKKHAAATPEFSKHGVLPESKKWPEEPCPPASTHGRTPAYPSRGCSPAEPPSVSPGNSSDAEIHIEVESNQR